MFAPIPDGESEHAIETFDTLFTPSVIGLEDDFAITLGEELVFHLKQLGAQFFVVVDGAVEDQGQMECLVHHRLFSVLGEIDDRQAAVTECERAVLIYTLSVRSAFGQTVAHVSYIFRIWGLFVET